MKNFLFIAIPFLILIFFALKNKKTFAYSSSDETSLDVLKKRYAKGEITKKEYEEMIKDFEK